jgi:proteasome lid subunit RPN8/RPN11
MAGQDMETNIFGMIKKAILMIRISEELACQIEQHGKQTYPEECCGMVLGSNKDTVQIVESIIEIDNSQGENRKRRFFITPQQYLQAERIAKEKNLELLGFYHSHPDHPAIPSSFDTEHALPFFTYIIVSISQGEAKSMTAWLLEENRLRFGERELSIEAVQNTIVV